MTKKTCHVLVCFLKLLARIYLTFEPMVQFSSVLPFWKPLNVSFNIGNSYVLQNGFLPAPKSGYCIYLGLLASKMTEYDCFSFINLEKGSRGEQYCKEHRPLVISSRWQLVHKVVYGLDIIFFISTPCYQRAMILWPQAVYSNPPHIPPT